MKKFIVILLLCLIPSAIFATDYYLGPKLGLNFCKAYGSGVDDYLDGFEAETGVEADNATALSGNFGAFSNFRFSEALSLQVEIYFTANKIKIKDGSDYAQISQGGLDIPVLLKYHIDNFNLFGGLCIFMPIGDSEWEYEVDGTKESEDDDTSDMNTGLVIGAGYDIPMGNGYLALDGRVFFGLTDIDGDIDDVKERKISFNIGYGFKLN
ncbi:MAG: porin family protein [Spirochaetia bacterium]|jgi:hypothetical protein|nr:porin family protein [Spirochaetia bacterium]